MPISPFVVAPQTKKLPLSSQNVEVREAETRPPIAALNGFGLRERRVVDAGAERAQPDVAPGCHEGRSRRAEA